MAALSASSRRNSSAPSVQNSPRPSLTGTSGTDLILPLSCPMSPLKRNLEDKEGRELKVSKINAYAERSDSGLSDCSNGSNQAPLLEPTEVKDVLDNASNVLVEKISVSKLKGKMERMVAANANSKEIALQARNTTSDSAPEGPETDRTEKVSSNAKPSAELIFASSETKKSQAVFMKSDFANTVKMRKRSLESNLSRGKISTPHTPLMLCTSQGKVLKLLQHFNSDAEKLGERKNVHNLVEQFPRESAFIECAITPLPRHAVTHQMIATRSNINKPALIETTPASAASHAKPVQKPIIHLPTLSQGRRNNQNVFERLSPTRSTNRKSANPQAEIELLTNKFAKTNLFERTGAAAKDESAVATDTAQKTTANATFNRGTPIRLSGRVKEVTDRLSTPKSPKTTKKFLVDGRSICTAAQVSMSATSTTISSSAIATQTISHTKRRN